MRGFFDNVSETVLAVVDRVRSNTALMAELGNLNRFRVAQDMARADAPLVQYTLVTDAKDETELPVVIWFAVFGRGLEQALRLESYIKRTFPPGLLQMGLLWYLVEYTSGDTDADPTTDVNVRSLKYRFRRLREYELPEPPGDAET